MPAPTTRKILSWLMLAASLCVAVLTLYLTYIWFETMRWRLGIDFVIFTRVLSPAACVLSLLLGALSSGVLYRRSRARRDKYSFWICGCSSLVIAVEGIAMYVLLSGQRLHGFVG